MAKFNVAKRSVPRGRVPGDTVNLAGGEAFAQSPELEFASILLTNFVKDSFYRSEGNTIKRIEEVFNALPDKKFAAQAAIFARKEYGMRSVSHITGGLIAGTVKGEKWTAPFFEMVVKRPDDMAEILSVYASKFAKINSDGKIRPIPNSLRKGFAKVLSGLDSYRLSKYAGKTKNFSLIDIINLIHPKTLEGSDLDKFMKGEIKPAETWETKLTQAGQKAETEEEKEQLKDEAWGDLVNSGKISYFALLRNLRNIYQQSPKSFDKALELLVDENSIKHSLVLPFRYFTAYNELVGTGTIKGEDAIKLTRALNKAIEISCNNVPILPGKTLIALDVSGSMTSATMGPNNKRQASPATIGSEFSALLMKHLNATKESSAELMLWATRAAYININPDDSIISLAKKIEHNATGGGTDIKSVFSTVNKAYDRIIILSDQQSWVGWDNPTAQFHAYKATFKCNPHIYSWDLQNYGTMQFPEDKVYALAGWSEKVFDMMNLLETDRQALVNEIKKIRL